MKHDNPTETIPLGRSDEGMTRASAEHEARLIASQILAGTWSPPLLADYVERDVPTIAQLADEHYQRKIRKVLRPNSLADIGRKLEIHLLPHSGHIREVRREKKYGLELDEAMALVEAAGTLDQRRAPSDELRRRILDMRAAGKVWKALAADLGIAKSTAIYHANRVVARPLPRYQPHLPVCAPAPSARRDWSPSAACDARVDRRDR